MKKFISNLITIIIVTLFIWMTASFVEVISNNLDPNPTYSDGNFFCILVEVVETTK